MSTPALLGGLAGLAVFFPAGIALLAQLRTRRGLGVSRGVKHPALWRWHGWIGWIALSGLLLTGVFLPLAGSQPDLAPDPRHLMHGILCTVCAVAVLGKAWLNHQKVNRKRGRGGSWVMAIVTLGASFFSLTCVLLAWRWTDSTATWDTGQWLIYQAAKLGHVALGIALICLGRAALRVSHSRREA